MSDIGNKLKWDIANFNRSLVVLNAYVCVYIYLCVIIYIWVYWLFMHACIYVNIYVCMYVDKLQLNVKIFSWNRRHKSTYRHVKNQRRIFLYKIHRENRKWFFLNTIRAPPSEVVLICMRKKIIVRLTLLVTDVSGSLSWSFFISIWKGNAFAVTPPLPAGFTTCEWERFEYSSRTAALLWRSRTAESVFVTPSRFIQRPSLEFLTLQRRTRNTSPHPWIFPIPASLQLECSGSFLRSWIMEWVPPTFWRTEYTCHQNAGFDDIMKCLRVVYRSSSTAVNQVTVFIRLIKS